MSVREIVAGRALLLAVVVALLAALSVSVQSGTGEAQPPIPLEIGAADGSIDAILAQVESQTAAIYMKIDGIDGESKDRNHEGDIDVLSWSWGVARSAATNGGGRRRGLQVDDITIFKELDKSTPKLFQAIVGGLVTDEVVFEFERPGDVAQKYLEITLTNVTFGGGNTTYSTGGAGGRVPVESFSLNFEEITITYTEFDPETGQAVGTTEFSYNVRTGS